MNRHVRSIATALALLVLTLTVAAQERDLVADFGNLDVQSIAVGCPDGEAALFDHVYLARSRADLELIRPLPDDRRAALLTPTVNWSREPRLRVARSG